jgi:uncharacterized protein YydD (DUF2326 family)
MQIYCFDVTLMRLALEQEMGPRFLIHDSHLFDGVDARQVAHAFRTGMQQGKEYDFQYLTTLNSDKAESLKAAGFDLQPFEVPVRLTDQPNGGLFGKQFG